MHTCTLFVCKVLSKKKIVVVVKINSKKIFKVSDLKMNWKREITCEFCKLIVKDPVNLPCSHLMCNHHADKVRAVKCPTCHEEYDVPQVGFRTNKLAKSLLEDEVFLNEEQQTAKRSIKEIALGFELELTEFISKNSNIICESFKSIQREIEIHRVELKVTVCKKIDDKALKLTQQVEEKRKAIVMSQQEAYKKIFENEFKSVVNAAEEQFRHPNVVMANVNRLKDELEKKMRDIQSKLKNSNCKSTRSTPLALAKTHKQSTLPLVL
jgi:hypothetical protein